MRRILFLDYSDCMISMPNVSQLAQNRDVATYTVGIVSLLYHSKGLQNNNSLQRQHAKAQSIMINTYDTELSNCHFN